MHRKRPRKAPQGTADTPKTIPLNRRVPAPPVAGLSRILVILAVYTGSIVVISIAGLVAAMAASWLIQGSSIWSGPGFIIHALGIVAFIWPALYLIGELDCWRKRGRSVSDKRS
jgi:uncharacterized RDD family membrane protein YckC